MTSLLEIRLATGPGSSPWESDALPYAYEEAGKEHFKNMPVMRWVRQASAPNGRGFWRGPSDAVAIVAATLEGAGVVKVRQAAPLGIANYHQAASGLSGSMPPALYDYQHEGAIWCAIQLGMTGGALLADEMGLGKTPQAIAAITAIAAPTDAIQVLCPAIMVETWQRESARLIGVRRAAGLVEEALRGRRFVARL